jgi:hypothetical protein
MGYELHDKGEDHENLEFRHRLYLLCFVISTYTG